MLIVKEGLDKSPDIIKENMKACQKHDDEREKKQETSIDRSTRV